MQDQAIRSSQRRKSVLGVNGDALVHALGSKRRGEMSIARASTVARRAARARRGRHASMTTKRPTRARVIRRRRPHRGPRYAAALSAPAVAVARGSSSSTRACRLSCACCRGATRSGRRAERDLRHGEEATRRAPASPRGGARAWWSRMRACPGCGAGTRGARNRRVERRGAAATTAPWLAGGVRSATAARRPPACRPRDGRRAALRRRARRRRCRRPRRWTIAAAGSARGREKSSTSARTSAAVEPLGRRLSGSSTVFGAVGSRRSDKVIMTFIDLAPSMGRIAVRVGLPKARRFPRPRLAWRASVTGAPCSRQRGPARARPALRRDGAARRGAWRRCHSSPSRARAAASPARATARLARRRSFASPAWRRPRAHHREPRPRRAPPPPDTCGAGSPNARGTARGTAAWHCPWHARPRAAARRSCPSRAERRQVGPPVRRCRARARRRSSSSAPSARRGRASAGLPRAPRARGRNGRCGRVGEARREQAWNQAIRQASECDPRKRCAPSSHRSDRHPRRGRLLLSAATLLLHRRAAACRPRPRPHGLGVLDRAASRRRSRALGVLRLAVLRLELGRLLAASRRALRRRPELGLVLERGAAHRRRPCRAAPSARRVHTAAAGRRRGGPASARSAAAARRLPRVEANGAAGAAGRRPRRRRRGASRPAVAKATTSRRAPRRPRRPRATRQPRARGGRARPNAHRAGAVRAPARRRRRPPSRRARPLRRRAARGERGSELGAASAPGPRAARVTPTPAPSAARTRARPRELLDEPRLVEWPPASRARGGGLRTRAARERRPTR